MSSYEYTVIPAPARGEKTKGAKSGIDRFAATLGDVLNEMARDGWEYVRAEVLPSEERSGLTGRSTVYHNLLIFRRSLVPETASFTRPTTTPEPAPQPEAPVAAQPVTAPTVTAPPVAAQPVPQPEAPEPANHAPFSQPMRAAPKLVQTRSAEPPLTRPEPQQVAASGPRLGPANR